MLKLGITGGIGAGKTVVASFLKATGIPVYVADDEAKKLTSSSPAIKTKLIQLFGEELFANDTLNKALLASLIFKNKENLNLVNSIIHPEVLSDFDNWVKKHNDKTLVAMESAILFESGYNKNMDLILAVTAPLEERIERIRKRNQSTREEILERISNQLPEDEKCEKSNFVIYNDNDKAIIPQIECILQEISVLTK